MTKALKRGDAVSCSSHGGQAHGKVVRNLTKPMTIKGHKVAASPDNPEFLIETEERQARRAQAAGAARG